MKGHRRDNTIAPVLLPVTMRADRATYIAFFFIFAMVPLFLMIVGLMKHGLDTIEYLCCSVIVLLQALAAFRYRIDLHDDKLIYTTLFSGSITIPFSMIESVTHGTTDDRYKPPIRLEIKPVTGTPHRPFYINLKIFRLQDIRVLFQVFEEKGLKVK